MPEKESKEYNALDRAVSVLPVFILIAGIAYMIYSMAHGAAIPNRKTKAHISKLDVLRGRADSITRVHENNFMDIRKRIIEQDAKVYDMLNRGEISPNECEARRAELRIQYHDAFDSVNRQKQIDNAFISAQMDSLNQEFVKNMSLTR